MYKKNFICCNFFSLVFLVIKILDPDLDPHWPKMLDPDLHRNQCGSTTLLLRIVDHEENFHMPSNIVLQLVGFSFCWNKYFKKFADILYASWIASAVCWLLQIVFAVWIFFFLVEQIFLTICGVSFSQEVFQAIQQCFGFGYGFESADSYLWLTDPDANK